MRKWRQIISPSMLQSWNRIWRLEILREYIGSKGDMKSNKGSRMQEQEMFSFYSTLSNKINPNTIQTMIIAMTCFDLSFRLCHKQNEIHVASVR